MLEYDIVEELKRQSEMLAGKRIKGFGNLMADTAKEIEKLKVEFFREHFKHQMSGKERLAIEKFVEFLYRKMGLGSGPSSCVGSQQTFVILSE